MFVNFNKLLFTLGLSLTLSPYSYGQNLVLDTIIKTALVANYNEKGSFYIDDDSIHLTIAYKNLDSLILLNNNLEGGKSFIGKYQNDVSWLMYVNFYDNSILIGSPSEHGILNLLNGEFTELSSVQTLKDVVINSHVAVSLETYPDYERPKQLVPVIYGGDLLSMNQEMSIPFDFPHYLAKPHNLFDIRDTLLCYCQTTTYECYLINLNTGKSNLIISEELNKPNDIRRIESFRKSIFKGSQQPKKWIPELTAFDDSIYRITKLYYDYNSILVIKKPPNANYDYRYLDKYEKKENTWTRVIQDYRIEKYPDTLSFNSPYCPIMYSSPIAYHNGKLYVLSSVDYTEGFEAGVSKNEFLEAKDKYYEDHDNYYTVFVYSFK